MTSIRLLEPLRDQKAFCGAKILMPRACGSCGRAEDQGEKFFHCARCKVVSYCSKACQVNHWKRGGHKQECAPPEAQEPAKPASLKTKGGAAEEPEGSRAAVKSVDDEPSKPMNKKPPAKSSSAAGHNSSSAGGAAAAAEGADKPPCHIVARVDAEGNELSFGEHDDCSICLDKLRQPIKLPCGHWFCKECMEGLRQARSAQDSCPTCREPLPPGAAKLFDEAWQIMRQVERKVERREEGWTNLRGKLQRDMDKVVELWKQAAAQHYALAQYNLGITYAHGRGVPQNDTTAVKWYEKAAEQGDAGAQFNLGTMYARGLGVPQSLVKARDFFQMAVDNGYEAARENLDRANAMLGAENATRGSRSEPQDHGGRAVAPQQAKKGKKGRKKGK